MSFLTNSLNLVISVKALLTGPLFKRLIEAQKFIIRKETYYDNRIRCSLFRILGIKSQFDYRFLLFLPYISHARKRFVAGINDYNDD